MSLPLKKKKVFFCLCWVFVAAGALVAVSRGYCLVWCMGFSLQWLLLVGCGLKSAHTSVVAASGLSNCGTRA